MLTFIKVNGAYIAFWVVMGVAFVLGVRWAVFHGVLDAINAANK